MPFRSNGKTHFPSTPPTLLLPLVLALFLNAISVPADIAAASLTPPDGVVVCGDGVVEGNEECDAGSPLGSPECDTLCRGIVFEPEGLPFEPRSSDAAASLTSVQPRIYSPRLACAPFDARDGARLGEPTRVFYRIHLCRTSAGQDAYTPQAIREVMATASDEFARAGIVLEEEALVRFSDDDCDMPFGDTGWEEDLQQNTPPGVLAVAFVAGLTSLDSQFSIGGFCYFQGPLCVNAGAFPSLVIHEVGHFFGLAHTFECAYGSETPETCSTNGDFLCDTPPDRGPKGVHGIAYCEGGTQLDGSCSGACGAKVCTDGSVPDSYDWMSYYHCEPGHFTDEQQDFMRCMLDHEMLEYNADPPTSTTTTTTLAPARCGDVTGDGDLTASDALGILKAGVGLVSCPAWICDYNGSGILSASDALAVLMAAVGGDGTADCPPDPGDYP